jgi:hypothetical protein
MRTTVDEADLLEPLYDGDAGDLPVDTREVLVRLLRGPYLDGQQSPHLWQALLRDRQHVRSRLNELYCELIMDEQNHVAFVRQVRDPDADVPVLMRRVPLTFFDTALLLFLRKELNNVDNAEGVAIVGVDDIRNYLLAFDQRDRGDEVAFNRKVDSCVNKMIGASVLRPTPTEGRFLVSPVLRLRFTAEDVAALARQYEEVAGAPASSRERSGEADRG